VEDSEIAAPPEMPIVIDHIALKDILGPPLFEMEVSIKQMRTFSFCNIHCEHYLYYNKMA